jgi:hypothetical protein
MNNNIVDKTKDSSSRSWTIHANTLEPNVDGEGIQLCDKWTIYKRMKILLNVRPYGLFLGVNF